MRLIKNIYWRYFRSAADYAKHLGVRIGNDCLIATRDWPSEPYLITIGNNCQITSGVRFHTHGGAHVVRRICPDFDIFGKIVIEDWVYIGAGSQLMPGVTIGEGSLVAAGSIVTKSVPPGVVVGGNPARILCTVDEYIQRNTKYDIGARKHSYLEKKELLLSLSDEKFIRK